MVYARRILAGGGVLIAMLLFPVTAALAQNQKTQNEEVAPPKLLSKSVPKIDGPRRMVAVGKFDAIGAFRQAYGD